MQEQSDPKRSPSLLGTPPPRGEGTWTTSPDRQRTAEPSITATRTTRWSPGLVVR